MMKTLCNLGRFLVVLFVAGNFGLAQSVQSTPAAQEQGPFAEINQHLNEAADAKLASAFPSSPKAEHVDGTIETTLSSGLLVVPTQLKGTSSRRAIANPLASLDALRWIIEPELARAELPVELTGIVLVESGGQTRALSPRGARGLWQFMPDTARRYGLVVTESLDERLDPYKSTRAAARYLRDLYAEFGNWPLALAAYNAGEDTVQRAVERTSTRDFSSIARTGMLPLETRIYVPAVLNAIAFMAGKGKDLTPAMRPSAGGAVVYTRAEIEN
jgi:soluble lytic murein transglycosylase-like protein